MGQRGGYEGGDEALQGRAEDREAVVGQLLGAYNDLKYFRDQCNGAGHAVARYRQALDSAVAAGFGDDTPQIQNALRRFSAAYLQCAYISADYKARLQHWKTVLSSRFDGAVVTVATSAPGGFLVEVPEANGSSPSHGVSVTGRVVSVLPEHGGLVVEAMPSDVTVELPPIVSDGEWLGAEIVPSTPPIAADGPSYYHIPLLSPDVTLQHIHRPDAE